MTSSITCMNVWTEDILSTLKNTAPESIILNEHTYDLILFNVNGVIQELKRYEFLQPTCCWDEDIVVLTWYTSMTNTDPYSICIDSDEIECTIYDTKEPTKMKFCGILNFENVVINFKHEIAK